VYIHMISTGSVVVEGGGGMPLPKIVFGRECTPTALADKVCWGSMTGRINNGESYDIVPE